MAMVISDSFDFNGTGYYYHYTSGTGADAGRLLANNYAPYATYWAYSAAAVYGKNVTSAIINITASTYTIGGNRTINVHAACAPLTATDSATKNIILSKNSSQFGAISTAVTLPKSADGSATLDITNVLAYAAEHYNQPWGLYLIGSGDTGYSSRVMFNVPVITTLSYSEGLMKVHDGSEWVDGVPYVHNGSIWKKAKAVYVHNGSNWVQV